MKKIILLSLLALGFSLAGCDSYDYKEPVPTVRVVSSELDLPWDGGTGTITTRADGAIRATSNSEWCQVAVEGSKVGVTVTANESFSNRTAMVKITCGDYSTEVPVTQSPASFDVEPYVLNIQNWRGGSATTTFTSDFPVEVVEGAAWLTLTRNGDAVTATASENTGTKERTGQFSLRSNGMERTVTVTQGCKGLYDYLVGDWTLAGTDFFDEAPVSYDVTLTEKEYGTIAMSWPTELVYQFQLPYELTFNFTANTLSMAMGQAHALSPLPYSLRLAALNTAGTRLTEDPSISFTGAYNGNLAAPSFTFTTRGKVGTDDIGYLVQMAYDGAGAQAGLLNTLATGFTLTKVVE